MEDHYKSHPDYGSMGIFAGYGEMDEPDGNVGNKIDPRLAAAEAAIASTECNDRSVSACSAKEDGECLCRRQARLALEAADTVDVLRNKSTD